MQPLEVVWGRIEKEIASLFLIVRDPPGDRPQDPNVKSVVLYLLS